MTVNLNNYRSSNEYREILRILQRASSLQENFMWQSSNGSRNVVPIHHFEIDFLAREVVIYFDNSAHGVLLDLPVYVKLDYRTSVFKVVEHRQGQGSVHFSFPKEIKTQELRINPRFPFEQNREKHVSLRSSLQKEGGGEIQIRVTDISYFGLGLIISEQNRSFMKNNRILWITKLQDQVLPHPILAEVVYVSNELAGGHHGRKQRELKVGLKLSGVFPQEAFDGFIQ